MNLLHALLVQGLRVREGAAIVWRQARPWHDGVVKLLQILVLVVELELELLNVTSLEKKTLVNKDSNNAKNRTKLNDQGYSLIIRFCL